MNTMKGFYASISSASHLQGSYQEALAKITKLSHKQAKTLKSDQGWQDWSQDNQIIATHGA